MKYDYYLFDLDGTITDSKEGITKSVAYALNSFGITVDNLDDLCPFIGPPLEDSFQKYTNLSLGDAKKAVEKYREYFSVTGIFENAVYEGIEDVLKELKAKGKSVLMATSKPTKFALKILEHFNLLHYFEVVVGSELTGERTHKNEVISYLLKEHDIDALKAVMIGDREYDILGAKENSMDSIGVLYGYGDYKELTKVGADYIAETTKDLKELLNHL